MPKFSIIIPVYNSRPFLPACLDSVLGQTVQDFELLLVDDGSTDGSGALCDTYADQYPCIRVFHKSNGGAASARNIGIENAVGEYLLFFDCDDTVEPYTLERCRQALSEDACDMVIFGMAFDYYEKDTLVRTDILSCGHSGVYSVSQIIAEFDAFFKDNALSSACNKVFRCECLHGSEPILFDESMTLYEDLEFVLRCLPRCNSVSALSEPLYHYRLRQKESHLAARVADPVRLADQLEKVNRDVLTLYQASDTHATACLNTAAALYLQCLSLHLSFCSYSEQELAAVLPAYCSRSYFRDLLAHGGQLCEKDADFLRQIDAGQFRDISRQQAKKRLRRFVRRSAKKLLQALGLRR